MKKLTAVLLILMALLCGCAKESAYQPAGAENVTTGTGEDLLQITIRKTVGLEKIRTDIQDHPFVGYSRLKFRPVDGVAAHQHHVPWLQGVPLAVYHISAPSGPEEQQLAEFVIVVVHLGALGVI